MPDPGSSPAVPGAAAFVPRQTAGGLLRQARQARGLHIAALATSIKVSPQKLELLETDRFDELPGATFTRALAQTVCRSLKIDAAPVMALLPQVAGHGLEQMSRGLNEPFRDRPGRRVPNDLKFMRHPLVLASLAAVLVGVGVYLLPPGWLSSHWPTSGQGTTASAPVATPEAAAPVVTATIPTVVAAPADGSASGPVMETVFSSVEPTSDTASAPPATLAPAAGVLQLSVTAESWVEVLDKRGVSLLSRMLQPGETVGLDGASPLRVKIGNASATQLVFKGAPVDLAPVTSRDNVAKLELR